MLSGALYGTLCVLALALVSVSSQPSSAACSPGRCSGLPACGRCCQTTCSSNNFLQVSGACVSFGSCPLGTTYRNLATTDWMWHTAANTWFGCLDISSLLTPWVNNCKTFWNQGDTKSYQFGYTVSDCSYCSACNTGYTLSSGICACTLTLNTTSCPGDVYVSGVGKTSVSVTVVGPSGVASCGTAFPSYNVTLTSLSTSYDAHAVLSRVRDSTSSFFSSNFCPVFYVRIDETFPVVTDCPGPISVNPTGGEATVLVTAFVNGTDETGAVTVNCGAHNAVLTSGFRFGIGLTTVTCSVADRAGNARTCVFTVTNTDSVPPTITCPSNYSGSPTSGSPSITLSSFNGTLSAFDAESGIVSAVCSPSVSPTSFTFPLGTTIVTCTATDAAANTNTCQFSVTVFDNTPPTLTCPSVFTYTTSLTDKRPDPLINFQSGVSATDPSGIQGISCPGSGTTRYYVSSNYSVSCTATDKAGLTSTCSFILRVIDDALPAIVCSTDRNAAPTAGTPTVLVYFAAPTSSDNSGIRVAASCNRTSPYSALVNTVTPVSCTTTDFANKTSSCLFYIRNTDTTKPTAYVPGFTATFPVRVTPTNGNTPTAVASWDFITSDASGIKTAVCAPASGTTFNFGFTSVTCTATDNANNVQTYAIKVEVYDTAPPTITCPANQVIKPNGATSLPASYTVPTPTDGSGIKNVSCSPAVGTSLPLGVHTFTCRTYDKVNLLSSCIFTIAISDNTPPKITCPGNLLLSTTGGNPSAPATFTHTASDVAGVTFNSSCTRVSGSLFALGNTTVTCTAINQVGLSASCSFNVVVVDTILPALTCPSNLEVDPDADSSNATVTFSFSATDSSGILTQSCDPPSGSQFAGSTSTTVTCSATDKALLQNNCSFAVTVLDIILPTISCSGNVQASPVAGKTNAVVFYDALVSDDNAGLQSVLCSQTSGSTFAQGETTVTCTATDLSGNQATCSFTVFVGDIEPPTVTCGADLTAYTSANDDTGVVNWSPALATDNSGSTLVTCSIPTSTTTFAVGNYSITCTAADPSGNTASCSFDITVLDNQEPTIQCPSSIATSLERGANKKEITWNVFAEDNVELLSHSCLPVSGSNFSYGSVVVTCTALDSSMLSKSCSFLVAVDDTEPPVINCPIALSAGTLPGSNMGQVTWTAPSIADGTLSDNVGIDFVSCTVQPSQTLYPLGDTTVTCTARDTAKNRASCSFTIAIVDTEKPAISCPASVADTIPFDYPFNFTTFVFDPLVAPTDNVGVVSVTLQRGADVIPIDSDITNIELGRTFFTYIAVDAAGNSASCSWDALLSREGEIPDLEAPIIVCPAQREIVNPTQSGKATGTATWPAVTATDNRALKSLQIISNPPGLSRGGTFPLGLSTFRYVATDFAGNFAECTLSITIVDNEAPKATCPPAGEPRRIECSPPLTSTYVDWVPPSFKDNVGLIAQSVTLSPGTYEAGSYLVVGSAQDAAGNTVTCEFSFIVTTDKTAPTFTCPPNKKVTTTLDSDKAKVTWSVPFPTDDTGIQYVRYTPTQYTSGASFPLGATVVTYTVVDLFNNEASCNFTITVQDKQAPTISCPANITVQIPSGDSMNVTWRAPIVSDNVNVDTITSSYASGSSFGAGVYLVVANVNDTSGNRSPDCLFSVTVLPEASSAASVAGPAAGAAGGAIIIIILVIIVVILIWTRRNREQLRKLEEQYGNMDMSDEAMLARAQAIQQALQNKKRNASPNMKWLSVPPIVFQAPPKTLAEMAAYLAQFGDKELPREHVVIESEIGAGEFGSVCSGYLKRPDGSKLTIAIKTLKDSGNETSKVKFLQEASIMIQFKHPKIVALVGVVTRSEPALICLEFCELGSLRSYLKTDIVFEKLSDADLIRMACDVCSAMHYLSESGFVHRDLAARNVLVNKDFICKVCDFGLSQEAAGEGNEAAAAEAAKDEKIPIRWTAPEAVLHHQFSTASDVWSFGILMWEMWSYGAMPYKGWANDKVMAEVTKGHRMPNPQNCPTFIYTLMLECWTEEYDERPAFYDVFQRLLAAWNICKPITNYAASQYVYDENGKRVKKEVPRPQDEIDEDDAYDLGGVGGKIAKPEVNANDVRLQESDEEEDGDVMPAGFNDDLEHQEPTGYLEVDAN